MHLDKYITFVYQKDDEYDPITSKSVYGEKRTVDVPCNVGDLTAKESKELFGKLDTQYLKVRLISPYTEVYHYVIYNNEKYNVIASRYDKVFYITKVGNYG